MSRVIAVFLLFFSMPATCQQVDVNGTRVWTSPSQTRLVIDVTGAVTHRITPLTDPDRLMVDIAGAQLQGRLPDIDAADPLLIRLRSGSPDGHNLRLVLDLKQPVRAKSFLMPPNERYGYRLIIDLLAKNGDGPMLSGHAAGKEAIAGLSARSMLRNVIVAIDAGHGGEDPGAIGPSGTFEKDITLAIARRLARLVTASTGMEALMIRDGDYYVGLRQRVEMARRHQADLFVSIHADAFHDPKVTGSSVYTLSVNGASSEGARWLAERENQADRIGGIELDEVDDDLNRVLFELARNGSLEHSRYAAEQLLTKLQGLGPVHHATVQQARFVVLKAPDVPSILVETSFISNPDEETRLSDPAYQQRIAEALMEGIKAYFARHPLPGTRLAAPASERHHVIHRGDTLGEIARRYDVTISALQSANRLKSDRIHVGDILTIPEG